MGRQVEKSGSHVLSLLHTINIIISNLSIFIPYINNIPQINFLTPVFVQYVIVYIIKTIYLVIEEEDNCN